MVHPTRTDGWTDSFKDKSLDDRQRLASIQRLHFRPKAASRLISLSVGMCIIVDLRLRECLKAQNRAGLLSTPNPFLWAVGTRSVNGMGCFRLESDHQQQQARIQRKHNFSATVSSLVEWCASRIGCVGPPSRVISYVDNKRLE